MRFQEIDQRPECRWDIGFQRGIHPFRGLPGILRLEIYNNNPDFHTFLRPPAYYNQSNTRPRQLPKRRLVVPALSHLTRKPPGKELAMKVLMAIDGSPYSQMTISMLKALKLPRETQVMLIE